MLESYIQKTVRSKVLDWALENDIAIMFLKLGQSKGWPDMMVVWENKGILFVEFKQPGEVPRKIQAHVHGLLRALGFEVQVHDNIELAVEQITRKISTSSGATARRGDHIP